MTTAKQLVDRYGITQHMENGEYKDVIRVARSRSLTNDAKAEIKSRKAEIIEYLEEQREAKQERQAKIDAIDGLEEIKDAQHENEAWKAEQERLFEQEDPRENRFGKAPNDIEAMRAAHPRADAYLEAESVAMSGNVEKAVIGARALDAIIDGGDCEAAIAEMNDELDELAKRWHDKLDNWD